MTVNTIFGVAVATFSGAPERLYVVNCPKCALCRPVQI